MMSPDGRMCHMHLGPVKSLCGACRFPKELVTVCEEAKRREPVNFRHSASANHVAYCPECLAAYEQHWLEMYPPAKPTTGEYGRVV